MDDNASHDSQTHRNHLGQPVGELIPEWTPPAIPSGRSLPGRFCRLERLEAERHGAELYAANMLEAEGRMWTYLPYGPFATQEAYLGWAREMSLVNDPLLYAIVDGATNRAIGVAGYLRLDPPNGSIEVGHVAYSPLLQRRPAATEAMFLLMEQVFRLGYRRYEWKCHALNEPSRAAALRLGFRFEGTFRQAAVVKGRSRDTAWFSITHAEWPDLREAFLRWLDPANFDEQGQQRQRLALLRDRRDSAPRDDLPLCECRWLERAAHNSACPIEFDPRLNEFNLKTPDGTSWLIYHCPFCAGCAPKSLREQMFAAVSSTETIRLHQLTKNLKTERQVRKHLGEPTQVFDPGVMSADPDTEDQPGAIRACKSLRYDNHSKTATINVNVGRHGKVSISFLGKYIGLPTDS